MTDLNDKVVLITGAGGGFGRHMTQQFLAAGSRVALTDIGTQALDAIADECAAGDRILCRVEADLGSADGCRKLYERVRALDLVPDVLVNNAGIGVGGRFDHVPGDRWEEVVAVNLLGPMRLCYLFLPEMAERGSGHVVNISSLAGWIGSRGLASYCATKFGLRGFGDSLRDDFEESGIRVSNVYPFFSRTPILDSDQFGYAGRREVPDDMVTDPADVVAAIVDGVRRERRDIFPDRMSRRIHYLKRFVPWLLPIISRRMDERIAAADAS